MLEDTAIELQAFQLRCSARDVPPCTGLVSEEVERNAEHSIADRPVGWIGLVRSDAEPLCQRERGPEFCVVDATGPQPPERPQLIVGLVEALGEIERGCPGRPGLARRTPRVHQRPAKRCMQLHQAACVGL